MKYSVMCMYILKIQACMDSTVGIKISSEVKVDWQAHLILFHLHTPLFHARHAQVNAIASDADIAQPWCFSSAASFACPQHAYILEGQHSSHIYTGIFS